MGHMDEQVALFQKSFSKILVRIVQIIVRFGCLWNFRQNLLGMLLVLSSFLFGLHQEFPFQFQDLLVGFIQDFRLLFLMALLLEGCFQNSSYRFLRYKDKSFVCDSSIRFWNFSRSSIGNFSNIFTENLSFSNSGILPGMSSWSSARISLGTPHVFFQDFPGNCFWSSQAIFPEVPENFSWS